jgi:hypothetical protein
MLFEKMENTSSIANDNVLYIHQGKGIEDGANGFNTMHRILFEDSPA